MNLLSNIFANSQMTFCGTTLFPGIAHGKVSQLKKVDLQKLCNDTGTVNLVSSELARIDLAVSKDQISGFMNNYSHDKNDSSYLIFEAELRFLNDRAFIEIITTTVKNTNRIGESVLADEIVRLKNNVLKCNDAFTGKGLITAQDLYYRILYNMLPDTEDRIPSLLKIPAGSILFADRLAPVEIAVIPIDKVVGILIEECALHSHAAIMIKALEIPVIVNFPGFGSLLDESTDVLIDAYQGELYLNPSDIIINSCQKAEIQHKAISEQINIEGDKSIVQSLDNQILHLKCNASSKSDIHSARSHGITEIGLFRSEILYLANTVMRW